MAKIGDTVLVGSGSYEGQVGTVVHTTPQKARIRLQASGEETGLIFKESLQRTAVSNARAESSNGLVPEQTEKKVDPSPTKADQAKSGEPTLWQVATAIAAYSLCSSMMVVVNKLAIDAIQISAVVTQVQFTFATVTVLILGCFGEDIGPFSFAILKGYFIYILAFAGGIYANMQGLKKLTPETTTVVRSCVPVIVLMIECLFMGRGLPSVKSTLALVGVISGAAMYCQFAGGEIKNNTNETYLWVLAWYLLLGFQMTYGKMLIKDYKLSNSGQVLYQNAISIPVILALGVAVQDYDDVHRLSMTGLEIQLDGETRPYALLWLFISSIIGVGIGYTAWACRQLVTPTSFTLVGVVNKVFTIIVSSTFINTNASIQSIAALAVCIICGMMYDPPPMRPVQKSKAE